MGYSFAKKGYRVLNLTTKQVFVSRDVKFVETSSSFDIVTSADSTTLPTLFPNCYESIYDNDPVTIPPTDSVSSSCT